MAVVCVSMDDREQTVHLADDSIEMQLEQHSLVGHDNKKSAQNNRETMRLIFMTKYST